MKQYFVILDTNVLVSALLSTKPNTATVELVKRLLAGEMIPLYSNATIKEYIEVLHRKKFKFDENLINILLVAIKKFGINIEPSPSLDILPDLKDLPFYEIVMEERKNDAHLVTGNLKHFPSRPYIVTPRQMLNIIKSG